MVYVFGALKKLLLAMLVMMSAVACVNAAANIVDVQFSEYVNEVVTYDPLSAGGGLYVDANENRSLYTVSGQIFVDNTHASESVENLVLTISPIADIYGLAFSAGAQGYVTLVNVTGDYAVLTIPDLGAGLNTTFTYNVNTTNVAPPLNFTTGYSDTKIFAGLPITVTDNVQNTMNSTTYPVNCIYNINVVQNALTINVSGSYFNFTYDNSTMAGADAANATFTADNRTINWNLWGGSCFNSGNVTDISYDVNTPSGVTVANTYQMINSTITYAINTTVSRVALTDIDALLDLELSFEKYMNNTLTGDNATWIITGNVSNPSNVDVNLTQVSFWVSVRNAGSTNPSSIDNDSISGSSLNTSYPANMIINSSTGTWDNVGNEWIFNYTFSASPIVWMDMNSYIINDGLQLTNRSVTYGNNSVYVKELYLATGYWIKITRNITRLAEGNYSVFIKVSNLGTSPTPSDQAIMVYNFIPNTFSLTSPFVFSSSTWYNTTNASQALNDPTYNGTMHQFGIIGNSNPFNSSLDAWGGAENVNNTWTVEYNVSGSGEFDFEDLFLTGVDPLNVGEYGATKALTVDSVYGVLSAKVEYFLVGIAAAVGLLLVLF